MPTLNQYSVGQQVQLMATFTDINGAPMDPTAVTAKIRDPSGAVTDLTSIITHQGLGVYTVVFTPQINGIHQYRFAGTGAVIAAGEEEFVAQSEFS